MRIQTVLFDLDGTLADTAPDLAHALNRLRVERGFPPLPFDAIRPVASHGTAALISLGFELGPESDEFAELRDRLIISYKADIAGRTRLFPGMEDLLDHLEARGIRWGVVTNKPAFLTEPLMQALALRHRAATIVSGDTLPHRKPHPAPMYRACIEAQASPATCIYLGDAERDIEAGRAAGMKTLVALWGYLGSGDKPVDWGADGLLEAPSDLLAWLDESHSIRE